MAASTAKIREQRKEYVAANRAYKTLGAKLFKTKGAKRGPLQKAYRAAKAIRNKEGRALAKLTHKKSPKVGKLR